MKYNLYLKIKLSKQAIYIRYVIANYQNLSNSASRPPQILFSSFFSKMSFAFHDWPFDDVMTFEYLQSQNLMTSWPKQDFKIKETIFFLVSQVLSLRLTIKFATLTVVFHCCNFMDDREIGSLFLSWNSLVLWIFSWNNLLAYWVYSLLYFNFDPDFNIWLCHAQD